MLPLAFKMTDFGVSRDISTMNIKDSNLVYRRGTYKYMAPEQVNLHWRPADAEDLFKVDVFQLGVVFFRLIFKAYPFESIEEAGVKNEKFFDDFISSSKNVYKVPALSDSLKTLLTKMLHRDNRQRCTMQEVL